MAWFHAHKGIGAWSEESISHVTKLCKHIAMCISMVVHGCVCMYVCMYLRTHVCMYVCMYVHVCMYV